MRFKDMRCGDTATVVNVEGEGHLRKRILDLGITRGVDIKMVRIAPLGDPIEIELRGYRLTIRKTEADIVELSDIRRPGTEGSE
ncbi:Fe2+ transport system protein A [Thermoplasmatales archaeon BRNA1]|nr:Fe2+ transport system protein A [Thermoplasmatales archaeon BRNA1]